MTTRDTMVGRIQDETRRTDANFTAIIVEHIEDAITLYQSKRLWFNESRDVTFSTVADQPEYDFGAGLDITTEFYQIDKAVLEEASKDYTLDPRPYTELETLIDGSSTSSRPGNYAYVNRALVLYPVPDAVYTVRLTGHVKLAAPAAGSTTGNEWMTEAFSLIHFRALGSLFDTVIHGQGSLEKAAIAYQREALAMRVLAGATTRKVSSGSLEPTQF